MVSVSRRASAPHTGQAAFRKSPCDCSGLTPVGAKSTSSGSRIGSWSSGTGWAPCSGQ